LTLAQILTLLSPELVLCGSGLLILLADLIWREKKGWLPWLALVGLAGALVATLALWGQSTPLPSEMMAVDAFALFFKFIAILATGLVVFSSIEYLRDRTPYRGEFYAFLLFATLAIALASAATNLVMVYVAMETLSITSYVLAGYLRDDPNSSEAAIKYFLYGAITSAVMLYGMSLLYGATGTTDLAQIAAFFLGGRADASLRWIGVPAIILLLAGFGFKAALVPFHQWTPDTYEGAPTPITAFLSVGSKAAGFAILMRVFITALPSFTESWVAILAAVSIVTMTLGNLVALRQTNIKRMLAYSSISHAGYLLIGVVSVLLFLRGETGFNGINGVLLYFIGYLFTNLALFMAVIAFENATGSNEIADYAGLIRRAPFLAAVLVVCFMSLAGIPPTAGFMGKFFVFGAAIKQRLYWLAGVAIVNSVISIGYYFNVIRYAFFLPARKGNDSTLAIAPSLRWPLWVATLMVLVIGVFPQPFIRLANQSVRMVMAMP